MNEDQVLLPFGQIGENEYLVGDLRGNDGIGLDQVRYFNPRTAEYGDAVWENSGFRHDSVNLKITSHLVVSGSDLYLFDWPPTPPIRSFSVTRIRPAENYASLSMEIQDIAYNPQSQSIAIKQNGRWFAHSPVQMQFPNFTERVLDFLVLDEAMYVLESTYDAGIAEVIVSRSRSDAPRLREILGKWSLPESNYDPVFGSEIVYGVLTEGDSFLIVLSLRKGSKSSDGYIETRILKGDHSNGTLNVMSTPQMAAAAYVPQYLGALEGCVYFYYDGSVLKGCGGEIFEFLKFRQVASNPQTAPLLNANTKKLVYFSALGKLEAIPVD